MNACCRAIASRAGPPVASTPSVTKVELADASKRVTAMCSCAASTVIHTCCPLPLSAKVLSIVERSSSALVCSRPIVAAAATRREGLGVCTSDFRWFVVGRIAGANVGKISCRTTASCARRAVASSAATSGLAPPKGGRVAIASLSRESSSDERAENSPWKYRLSHDDAEASSSMLTVRDTADDMLSGLEQLVAKRLDPEKARWRRLTADINNLRRALSAQQAVRLLAILGRHLVALGARSTGGLLEAAMARLSDALAPAQANLLVESGSTANVDLSPTELSAAAWTVAQVAVWETDVEYEGAIGTPETNHDKVLAVARRAQIAQAQALLWDHLLFRVTTLLEAVEVGESHANVLMAVAVAWRTLPMGWHVAIEPGLRTTVAAVLEDARVRWRRGQGGAANGWTLARLVGALGMLDEQGALRWSSPCDDLGTPSSSTDVLQALTRNLGTDTFRVADLPSILLLHFGLRGFARDSAVTTAGMQTAIALSAQATSRAPALSSRLNSEVNKRLAELLSVPGGFAGAGGEGAQPRQLVLGVILLRLCDRFRPNEPLAISLLLAAANAVDTMQRGERPHLRAALGRLANDVAANADSPVASAVSREETAERPRGPAAKAMPLGKPSSAASLAAVAGSPEAAVCALARLDWFSRKHRANISWFKNRGASR